MDIEETNKNEIIKKGPWKPEEDLLLKSYIETHGEGKWTTVSKRSGLMRGAKSCRMRWKNHLRPNIKRGQISEDEEDLIIRMHKLLGNRWSLIAGRLPGRTDNEVKNYWNTHISKRHLHQCQSTIGSSDFKNKIRRVLSHTTMDTHSTSTTRDETKINGSSDEGGINIIIQNTDDYQTQLPNSNSRTRNNNSKIDGSGEGLGEASLDNTQPITYASTGSTRQDDKIINRTDEAGGSVEQISTDLPADLSMDEDAMRRSEDDILSWWLSDETTFYVPFFPSSTLDFFSVLSFESSFDQHSSEECWNNKYQSWF